MVAGLFLWSGGGFIASAAAAVMIFNGSLHVIGGAFNMGKALLDSKTAKPQAVAQAERAGNAPENKPSQLPGLTSKPSFGESAAPAQSEPAQDQGKDSRPQYKGPDAP